MVQYLLVVDVVGQEKQLQHRLVVLSVSSCGDGSEHYITTCNHCQCSSAPAFVPFWLSSQIPVHPQHSHFPRAGPLQVVAARSERDARMSRGYGNNGSHIYPNILVWGSTPATLSSSLSSSSSSQYRDECADRRQFAGIHHPQMKRIPSGSFEAGLHGWVG